MLNKINIIVSLNFTVEYGAKMVQGYPYKAEYAKSGRATCIGCDTLIAQDNLRIAQNVQVRFKKNHSKLLLTKTSEHFA